MTTKQIEKKIGKKFMTVILSFDKIETGIRDVTRMMMEKEFAEQDIKAYVSSLVDEAIERNQKEFNK